MKQGFTISEAAKLLNVHPNTLRKWEKQKKLIPERNKATSYRHYSDDLIRAFLLRGAIPKIDVQWGYDFSKRARVEELSLAKRSLDVIVSSSVTTTERDIDSQLFMLLKQAVSRGVKARFIRDLSDPEMRRRAEKMKLFGVETKNRKIYNLTVSIRDREVVRVEVPSEDPELRFNLVIADKKVAESFELFFEKLWQ